MTFPVEPVAGLWRRLLAYWLIVLLAWQPLLPALAAGVSVAAGNTQTLQAGNGVPVVNIATPNQAGVSHNQYQQFNVGGEGLILNNATDKLTQSQLGGLILNNPNLQAGREAKSIINEVVGANRSQLQGYMEVAGKAANVMVANPYGITCNGCGFINTPNATLTTGKPVLAADGSLQALEVTQGDIIVEGRGLDAGQSDAFSLLARATQINAGLYAKELTVAVGANRIDAAGNITALGNQDGTPRVAVDTGALGGMYANRIRLVSSDKGVGVNLGNLSAATGGIALSAAGDLTVNNAVAQGGATAGDLALSADGKLTVNNAVARGSLNASGNGLQLGGNVAAQNAMALASRGDLAVDHAMLSAGDGLRLDAAGQLSANASTLSAGIDSDGNVGEQGTLWLKGAAIRFTGSQGTAAGTQLTADGDLRLDAASQLQARQLTLSGQRLQLDGQLSSNRDLTVNGAGLSGAGSAVFGSQQNINLNLSDSSQWNGQMLAGTGLHFRGGNLTNGGQLLAVNELTFDGIGLDNGGRIQAGDLALTADSLNNRGQIQAQNGASLNARSLTQQTGAGLLAGDNLTVRADSADTAGSWQSRRLDYQGGDWHNNGAISTLADMAVDLGGTLRNDGDLLAKDALALTAVRLDNQGGIQGQTLALQTDRLQNAGTLISPGRFDLTVTGALTNLASGRVLTDDALNIAAGTLGNQGVMQGGTFSATADRVDNQGQLQGTRALSLKTLGDQNYGADSRLLSDGTAMIQADGINNAGLWQAGVLQIAADHLDNGGAMAGLNQLTIGGASRLTNQSAGRWLSDGDIQLSSAQITNGGQAQGNTLTLNGGTVSNGGSLTGLDLLSVTATGTLDNGGKLLSNGNGTLAAGQFNQSGFAQAQQWHITADALDNNGVLAGIGGLWLTLTGAAQNRAQGQLLSNGESQIHTTEFTNGGLWQAASLLLTANNATNQGRLQGSQQATLTLANAYTGANGSVLAGGDGTSLSAAAINNAGILQAKQLRLTTGSLTNDGTLQGTDLLDLRLSGDLANNAGASLLGAGRLQVLAQHLTNRGMIQGGDVSLNGSAFDNSGTTQGNQSLGLALTGPLNNLSGGQLLSGGQATLGASQFTNDGWLQAQQVVYNGNQLNNNGTLLANDSLQLTAPVMINQGTLQAGNATVNSTTLTNRGTLLGLTTLALQAAVIDNQSGGRIYSAQDLNFTTGNLQQNGRFVALGNLNGHITGGLDFSTLLAAGKLLTLRADGDFNQRGTLQGNGVQLIAGGTLTNSGQVVTGGGGLSIDAAALNLQSGGSLQSGGAVNLTSRNDINNQGFVGTLGDLLLQAAATLTNTGLLYSGGNMHLLANGIHNLRGDILAGNSLWMQRDASGNANGEIINTSGDIETQNGDINIATAHLLNQRDGFSVSQTNGALAVPTWANGSTILIPVSWFQPGEIGVYHYRYDVGGGGESDNGYNVDNYYYAAYPAADIQQVAVASTTFRLTATGNAGRLVAGHDINAYAGSLENIASNVLAGNNINLHGNSLSNTSYQEGTTTQYQQYKYSAVGPDSTVDLTRPNMTLAEAPAYYSTSQHNPDGYPINGVAYTADGAPIYAFTGGGQSYNALIQAGGAVNASFNQDISNTTVKPNIGGIDHQLSTPSLGAINTLESQSAQSGRQLADSAGSGSFALAGSALDPQSVGAGHGGALTPTELGAAIQNGLRPLSENPLADYPLPSGNNGLFVLNTQPGSHYLITTNPKLQQLGKVDGTVFNDLQGLLGQRPTTSVTVETDSQWTNPQQFLGSAYLLDKLNLKADYDYRFLGDAAFDTRYISNAMISQTGQRYLNGVGSDLAQMQYLLDNAAAAQHSLNLQFGVSLTPEQVASLTHSIIWWEPINVDGNIVLAPKLYLAKADETNLQGSVIGGQQVALSSGTNVTNSGAIQAVQLLDIASQGTITNQGGGLLKSDGSLDLTALNDISNLSSTVEGGSVRLTSLNGSIVNQTQSDAWSAGRVDKNVPWGTDQIALSATETGNTAAINATGNLVMSAGKDISIIGATLKAGGSAALTAGNNVIIAALAQTQTRAANTWTSSTTSQQTGALASAVNAGGGLSVNAGNDLTVTGSSLTSGCGMALAAGNDINLLASASGTSQTSDNGQSHTSSGAISSLSSGGDLSVRAGNDINSQAAKITAGGNADLNAGRDVNLAALQTGSYSESHGHGSKNIDESIRQQGTDITSGGATGIRAGQDINTQAASVNATGDLALNAGRDINIASATASDYRYDEKTTTSKHLFSSTTTHTVEEDYATHEQGSQLGGNHISLAAGRDIGVVGSSIAGDSDVTLKAGNNVAIVAATENQTHYQLKETKKSGLMGGGGLGISIGKQSSKSQYNGAEVSQRDARSTLGTSNGNVTITAGKDLLIAGSDVIAGRSPSDTAGTTGNISLDAQNIALIPGRDETRADSKTESSSSGFGLSLKGTPYDSYQNFKDIGNTQGGTQQAHQYINEIGAMGGSTPQLALSYGKSSSSMAQHTEGLYQSGSALTAAGDITLHARGNGQTAADGKAASGDITVLGSSVHAGGDTVLDAARDINLQSANETQTTRSQSSSSSWGVSTATADAGTLTRHVGGGPNNGAGMTPYAGSQGQEKQTGNVVGQVATTLSGNNITLTSHTGDIHIAGSAVSGKGDILLSAEQGNVLINAGQSSARNETTGSSQKIGDLGGDGYSGTVGWQSSAYHSLDDVNQQSTLRSSIESGLGNVNIIADKDVHITGSDISAGNSITLSGTNVLLDPSVDTEKRERDQQSKQYGVTTAISGYGISALQSVEKATQSAEDHRDPRLTAIYAAQAALDLYTQTVATDFHSAAIKVTASVGGGSSSSQQEKDGTTRQGTTLTANNDVTVVADKNITGVGVDIRGRDVSLSAGDALSLSAAQNEQSVSGSSSGSHAGVGVGFGLGGNQNGFTIELSASGQRSTENGATLTNQNSHVTASGALTLASGGDTTLKGAVVSGNSVQANVGGNLTVSSVQDTATYDSKSTSGGINISICVPPICLGQTVAGNANLSQQILNNHYASVAEQSGIKAGSGGYNIIVKDHTQLDGGVIASTAPADKNQLQTGTLGWRDIANVSDYQGAGYAVGVSTSSIPTGGLGLNQGKETGTTRAAVSPGTITLTDPQAQTQDLATLSRDTQTANGSVKDGFNQDKVNDRLEIQRAATALSAQAMGTLQQKLESDAQTRIIAKYAALGYTPEQITRAIANDPAYQAIIKDYGIGGKYWTMSASFTTALAGLMGGNIQGAAVGAAAPYLANLVKQIGAEDEPLRVVLHTALGAFLAAAQGGNAAAGAAGALAGTATASTAEQLARLLFKDAPDGTLTEDQKQVIDNLVVIAGSVAGGVAGGGLSGVGSGANTAKNEVENNYLSSSEKSRQTELNHKQNLTPEEQKQLDALNRKDAQTSKALVDACMNGSASACVAARQDAIEKQSTYQNLGYQNLKEAQDGYQQIQALLEGTSQEAKQTQALFTGMVAAYMRTGMSEENAKSAVGYQLGAMYIVGGIAGIGSGKAVDEGLTPGTKPGVSSSVANTKASLLEEMTAQGIKYTPENIVQVVKNTEGKIIFLESGNSRAGLQHIIGEHAKDFANIGVSEAQIPDVVMKAVSEGKIVGYQGEGTGRPIYETIINGEVHRLAITVSSNGFMVGANPAGRMK